MEGIGSNSFLKMEWTFSTTSQAILEMVGSRKIVCFLWLLVHRAIAVNGWLKRVNVGDMFSFCMNLVETSNHCLWSCDFMMEI